MQSPSELLGAHTYNTALYMNLRDYPMFHLDTYKSK